MKNLNGRVFGVAMFIVSVSLSSCSSAKPSEQRVGDSLSERFKKQEKAVAACMKGAGFDYKPELRSLPPTISIGPIGQEVSWKRKHGYGISEALGNMRPAPPSPNEPIRSSLSQADQVAYDKALFGAVTPGQAVEFKNPRGCLNESYGLTNTGANLTLPKTQTEQADQEVQAILVPWRRCLAKQGYIARDEAELVSKYVMLEQARLFVPNAPAPNLEAGEVNLIVPDIVSPAKVDELLAFERKIGAVDADCMDQKTYDRLRSRRVKLATL
jgi:hypothetical protein